MSRQLPALRILRVSQNPNDPKNTPEDREYSFRSRLVLKQCPERIVGEMIPTRSASALMSLGF